MNIFSRFRALVDGIGLFFDKRLWHTVGGSRSTTARVDVSEDSALNYSAIWCAMRLICGTCANLSLPVYEIGADGESRKKLLKHPVTRILNTAPNPEMTPFNFRSVMWQWQVNWGNAYAEIVREGNNPEAPLEALWPLHPATVTPMRDDSGDLYYEVRNGGGDKVELKPWQMLHLPSIITYDGIVGHGVIQHARETIGAGLAAEKKAANTYGSGGIPAIVVEHARKWNEESRAAFRKEWKEIHGGPDGDTVALLTDGAIAKPLLGLSERDNQFLESRQFAVEEIARWYGIPPHLLHHLLRATFNNIEELGIDFVRYCLLPWLGIWHQGIRQKLFTPDERDDLFVEHDVDELMDGNAQSRATLHQMLVGSGIKTRNECRRAENLDPVPGGDVFLVQGAMVPLDADGKPESEFVKGPDTGAPSVEQVSTEMPRLPSPTAVTASLHRIVEERLSHLMMREEKKMQSCAEKPADFVDRVDEFYTSHRTLFIDVVHESVTALNHCGYSIDTSALASTWVSEGKSLILEAAGTATPKELPDAVKRVIESKTWSERPERAVGRAYHATSLV